MSTTPTTNGNSSTPQHPQPPLTPRTLLLILAAGVVGIVIGVLMFLGTANIPTSIVSGITAAGVTFYYGHKLLDSQ